jgi:hypothetical protein
LPSALGAGSSRIEIAYASGAMRFAVLAALLVAAPAAAQPSPPERVERCRANDPRAAVAADAILAFGEALRTSRPDAQVQSLEASFQALLALDCLRPVSRETLNGPVFASVAGVIEWWNAGGREWLESYLQLPMITVEPRGEVPHVVFPPDERRVIPSDRLAAVAGLGRLLCPENDASCGAETRGWLARAERAYAAHERAEEQRPGARVRADAIARCAASSRAGSRDARFIRWLRCVSAEQPQVWAFPLGSFRAPRTGWLVVRGRRGHYRFCDEVRAYDLATGSAYVAQSCSGLALRSDGTVDQASTDRARNDAALAGSVPADNLRELLLMLLLDPVSVRLARDAFHVPIPPGMSTTWVDRAGDLSGTGHGSAWGTSAQTQLAWSWIDGDDLLAEGTLTWPSSYRAPEAHAAELLSVVDDGFAAGCPAVGPPPSLGGGRGRVSGIDADASTLAAVDGELTSRILRYRTPAACARTRMHRW